MNPILFIAGKLNPKYYYRVAQLRYRFPWFGRVLTWLGNSIRNRDATIQQGLAAGLRFNAGNSIAGYVLGTQEPQVQSVCSLLIVPGMTVYDLGANVGFLSVIFAKLTGAKGHVVSFEPLPSNARQIAYNVALNEFSNVKIRQEAAGRIDGTVVFRSSAFPTTGKLEEVQKVQHGETSGSAVDVSMRSLDSIVAEGESTPDFIKMDIEGGEVECLLGASRLLAQQRPLLLIEVHATNQQVHDILTAANYRVAVIGSPLSLPENHWNVQIIACPAERPLTAEQLASVTDPKLLA